MYFGVALQASVECPACRTATPLDDLAASVTCAGCSADAAVDWEALFQVSYRGETVALLDLAPACKEGERYAGAGPGIRAAIEVARPRCACGASVSDEQLGRIHLKTRAIACSACAAEVPARLVRGGPANGTGSLVRFVLGGGSGAGADAAATRVLRCAACGGPLPEEARGASIACPFCSAANRPAAERPALGGPLFVVFRVG